MERVEALVEEARRLRAEGNAEQALERLAEAKKLVANESTELAELLEFEATLLSELNDDARPVLEQALGIWESRAGSESPEVARVAIALGHAEVSAHRPSSAEPLFKRALRIAKRVHGEASPQVFSALMGLFRVDWVLCRVDRAKEHAARIMSVAKRSTNWPEKPERVANAHNSLAALAMMEGDYVTAMANVESGLKVDGIPAAVVDGRRYSALRFLAEIAQYAGQFTTAAESQEVALEIAEREYSNDHFARWSTVLGLHFYYRAAGESAKLGTHDAAYGIRAATFGELWPPGEFPLFGLCERELPSAEYAALLAKTESTHQSASSCVPESLRDTPSATMAIVWIRTDRESRIVAASAAGIGYPESVLACSAQILIGKPWYSPYHPRGFDWFEL